MEAMIAEVLVSDTDQLVCHKQGKDIFKKMAEHVAQEFKRLHSIEIDATQILDAFNRRKVGSLTFMVGEHTVKWTLD
ncbi:hypothetical protein [Spirosoma fluviale]|uniref:Uncharacterized protein n=1 Tax=Spirosoma fluviale TaxID=1597977 RepID=A0A286GQ39_9BACT|nr:hypothetical protein [Spirosoma fluviale]SOD97630.1 hypothetical protein SAMN06269250_5864 [Spirosoma fluviale]